MDAIPTSCLRIKTLYHQGWLLKMEMVKESWAVANVLIFQVIQVF
jgi:hypothetical protein